MRHEVHVQHYFSSVTSLVFSQIGILMSPQAALSACMGISIRSDYNKYSVNS